MNRLFFIFISLALFATATGQSYSEAIKKGDEAFNNRHYKDAIDFYFAAAAFMPNNNAEVKDKVKRVFDAIETLREQAEKAKIDAQKNLERANNLANLLYFYAGRFALIFKDQHYYFIDKNGVEVTKLGKWDNAEQFDESGFAKTSTKYSEIPGGVKQDAGSTQHIIDSNGRKYKLYTDLKKIEDESVSDSIAIIANINFEDSDFLYLNLMPTNYVHVLSLNGWGIDFNFKKRSSIISKPKVDSGKVRRFVRQNENFTKTLKSFMYWKNLNCLELKNFGITIVPEEIGQLVKLRRLSFYKNKLGFLPTSIGKLVKLKELDLRENNFSETEINNIKKLLPNCNILF